MPTSFADVLVAEHSGFKTMLSVLEAIARRMSLRAEVPPAMVVDVIDFFGTFTDRHHAREERALFPVLARHGVGRDQTVVQALLAQHDAGRVYCGKLREDRLRLQAGDEAAVEDFASHAFAYCELIREHIRIEDDYFYKLADQLLSEAEHQDVISEFSSSRPGAETDRFLRMLNQYPAVVAGWK
ncbi:MAG: hemerythrin domain-containing protein [Acidobacteriota bacterium]